MSLNLFFKRYNSTKMRVINFQTAQSDDHFVQILQLQQANLSTQLPPEIKKSQGFVTVQHNLDLLKAMNTPYPHIIAQDENKIVGYALVMLPHFSNQIPILAPMFEKINSTVFKGKELKNSSYFVMGQVCVASEYRGTGVFKGLYTEMQRCYAPYFDYLVTEVSELNTRSQRAHANVGFQTILTYNSTPEKKWHLILWDWKTP